VVVIASSSGGLQALKDFVSRLPSGLPATVLIACHTSVTSQRSLPGLLSASSPLLASYPDDGQVLEPGRIFVAPPDRHLVVQGRRLHLTSGAKEHGMRPAADVLFRSAARELGSQGIGVVLSGGGHDGAAGLAAIQAAGGLTLVQASHDARLSTMPLSALAAVKPDAWASAVELGTLVARLVLKRGSADRGTASVSVLTPPGGQRPRSRSLKGLRVFVAEDEYLITSAILGMLHELGCIAVGPVADVDRGLRLLGQERGRLDCALLDVDLQGRTALPLALVLGEQAVPLIFATGYGKAVLPEAWATAPRIQKPYTQAVLDSALRRALRLHWRPPATAPQAAPDIDPQQETLKDARNGLMRSHALLASYSRDALLRSQEALKQTAQRLAESARIRQARQREPPSPPTDADAP
jgi:DNA-binding LytR/AlgR family response regulator